MFKVCLLVIVCVCSLMSYLQNFCTRHLQTNMAAQQAEGLETFSHDLQNVFSLPIKRDVKKKKQKTLLKMCLLFLVTAGQSCTTLVSTYVQNSFHLDLSDFPFIPYMHGHAQWALL